MPPALLWTLTIGVALSCAGWTAFCLRATRGARSLRPLEESIQEERADLPLLSVVIAARDEADSIESALGAWLSVDYPDLEILFVDDRSTDGTGQIAGRLAAEHPRLEVVRIDELPDGWLGKVHALQQGARRARGEWILFTDADVHVSIDLPGRAVAAARRLEIDHLALLPEVQTHGVGARIAMNAFCAIFVERTRLDRLGPAEGDAFVGVGAFNLVRREVLDRSEGFEWIRMDVADDVGLGLVLQRAGARAAIRTALGDLNVVWYPNLRSMIGGLEKNLFPAACYFDYRRLAAMILAIGLLLTGPFVAFLPGLPTISIALGGAAWLSLAILASTLRSRFAQPFLECFALPIGLLLITWMIVRSAYYCWRRDGITWRGTLYPIDALRQGQRVRI